jgi:DNA-binding GntR family transcriptional regulator
MVKGDMKAAAAKAEPGERARPATLASAAHAKLRHDVIRAVWMPGEKLNISQLCARYDIGLSPMREALNRLAQDGLVTHTEQRGFRVTPLGESELVELNRTRGWLCEIGLRESMAGKDASWEERVLLASHRLAKTPRWIAATEEINPAWEQAHREFHASLVAACGSHWLIGYCEQLFDAAERYRHLSRLSGSRNEKRAHTEHRAITEAVLAGDADRAVKILLEHFATTARFVKANLSLHRSGGDAVHPPASGASRGVRG